MHSNFKKMRINAGLSQRDVSDTMGWLTPQYVINFERGLSTPPIGCLKRLAKMYKVDAEDLLKVIVDIKVKETTDKLERAFRVSR